jgi:phage tail protein X
MTTTYKTVDGDMLDEIVQRFYRATDGFLEQVLALNPGIAARGPRLPAGLTVRLPDAKPVASPQTVELW